MSPETLSHAERLAQRLIDGDGDEATYHELRFEAMAVAHAWESAWLAAELVAIFDKTAQEERVRAETAAVVLGMLRGVRLARAHGEGTAKAPAWGNPALIAAGMTTIGMIVAAIINQYGGMKAANTSQATVQPAVVKPNIQIVLPSTAANTTPTQTIVVQQSPAPGQVAATPKPTPTATATASPKASTAPAAPAEPAEAPAETTAGT